MDSRTQSPSVGPAIVVQSERSAVSPVHDGKFHQQYITHVPYQHPEAQAAVFSSGDSQHSSDQESTPSIEVDESGEQAQVPQFVYAHMKQEVDEEEERGRTQQLKQSKSNEQLTTGHLAPEGRAANRRRGNQQDVTSIYSMHGDIRNQAGSPGSRNISSHARARSAHSSEGRLSGAEFGSGPTTPLQAPTNFDNSHLRKSVGLSAQLLTHKATLDLYRKNAEKSNDAHIQYEFAIFLISAAQSIPMDQVSDGASSTGKSKAKKAKRKSSTSPDDEGTPEEKRALLLKEAKQILQKLSDRSFVYAQYYLADGLCSGIFTADGRPDLGKAFELFVQASKHGHAESAYRAGLAHEFGWGTSRNPAKATLFYRTSASKNHPGAMLRLAMACLRGELTFNAKTDYREGLKWLKRAAESADQQYPTAPYELGLLHENGDGRDIFKDQAYTARLFSQAADLGHAEATYRMGEAYEKGLLSCPIDVALSIHYYTEAANRGHPIAMMGLVAYYVVGAPPLLDKDPNEAFAWAKRAAELNYPTAMFTVGYFTEAGLGTTPSELEANKWFVLAAEHGDERAITRLETIYAMNNKQIDALVSQGDRKQRIQQRVRESRGEGAKDKDCTIM